MQRVLILGGTTDAYTLAAQTTKIPDVEIITSLAGRTRQPIIPTGEFRIGGFGGETGLVEYLRQMQIDVLIDATHPFAAQISENATNSANKIGIPYLMLVRPAWERVEGDNWLEVESIEAAATSLENQTERVFLTIGRQELTAFAHLHHIWFLMRMIDPPTDDAIVPQGEILCDRGPFSLDNEREILQKYKIHTIVSKNSGGNATYPKIIAARELGIKVVMVKRPKMPPGEKVADIDSAIAILMEKLS
ncbi:cobalt-precorrin-6A reductase [Brunnivagina elsteri]|uniref:Cobalt-precorrin-6A reductase n=1 Tax=Brunnivagina elsteri CCALA 953 TaxID=987040 RepID=A0A2A2TLV6_9CYAN|nr:cobalt-precorrin-6A reductase [Calothrix elsteri]PAX58399.1 cobalt-precorrin-6A reductase [Calothrix elsteri CCALA 953]